ncbi:response regulator transcription factor [Terrimonas pollutisoli]|uniref:response regulator transcription factor n=1 Tax=Terrimonas pollutisoli TaxID=3034147 RepID=UPI0023ED86E4|nr:response regulator [Terrimonas sp. H1YJ31]
MNQNRILIIEDTDEIREFVKICLETDYAVLEAENGLKGWEIAVSELPDLIITDVIMPEMDGNEFCRNLKQDERTSHIPVIMLTAKIAVEQQLEGLESGADVYLTKPFSIQVLQTYISNLLKSKEVLRQRYSQKIFLQPLDVEVGTVDKKFMERLMSIIEQNLSKSEFNVPDLAKEVGMSKAVLYKKFSALVKIPIGEFIKSMRLKKAALLLTHDKMNISEVAWEVGFSDRKYFSKEFKKFFGKSPSDYLG